MIVIIGIDPGSNITGYGIIICKKKQFHYLQSGIIKNYRNRSFWFRIKYINFNLNNIIIFYKPDIIVIEKVFIDKNYHSSVKLGQVSGFLMNSFIEKNLPIFEYSNLKTKKILNKVTFNKENINKEIKSILNINDVLSIDASDALSIALSHCYTSTFFYKNKINFNFGLIIWRTLIVLLLFLY